MEWLRCHGDSDCNKTQIIRNFNIWLGRYPPKKIQSSHLNSFEFNCFFLNSVNETIRTIHVRGTTEEKKEETSLPFSITDTDITCKRNDAIQWRIQGRGRAPPLLLDQTEAWRAEKKNLSPPPPPPYLRVWMTGLPLYLKVWIRCCWYTCKWNYAWWWGSLD